jgi:peptidoglycan/LPS O-acetylase OafA/YrhL
MAGWHYRDWFQRHAKTVLLASLLVYAVAEASGLGFLRPASLGGIVLYLATGFRYLGNAGRYGDLSYGVYIYHFPILHMLFHMGLMGTSPWLGGALAILATLAAAWLSWWVIEKRFLLGSSHYRQAEKEVYCIGAESASRVLPAAKGRRACQSDAAARPASPARR